jgi:hypothetical protein
MMASLLLNNVFTSRIVSKGFFFSENQKERRVAEIEDSNPAT